MFFINLNFVRTYDRNSFPQFKTEKLGFKEGKGLPQSGLTNKWKTQDLDSGWQDLTNSWQKTLSNF